MQQHKPWKQLARKTVYSTPHLRVFEDTVQLPGGATIDDYSVVEFNDVIMMVATDTEGNVITLEEYRYAANQTMVNLPAGSIRRGSEDVAEAAKRELLEETGYKSDNIAKIAEFYEYPTKATHVIHVFRIKDAVQTGAQQLEASEQLRVVLLRPEEIKQMVFSNKIKTASACVALVSALPELFGGN